MKSLLASLLTLILSCVSVNAQPDQVYTWVGDKYQGLNMTITFRTHYGQNGMVIELLAGTFKRNPNATFNRIPANSKFSLNLIALPLPCAPEERCTANFRAVAPEAIPIDTDLINRLPKPTSITIPWSVYNDAKTFNLAFDGTNGIGFMFFQTFSK